MIIAQKMLHLMGRGNPRFSMEWDTPHPALSQYLIDAPRYPDRDAETLAGWPYPNT